MKSRQASNGIDIKKEMDKKIRKGKAAPKEAERIQGVPDFQKTKEGSILFSPMASFQAD